MALLNINDMISQYAMQSGLLNSQGQMTPPPAPIPPQQGGFQGLLASPGLSQALLYMAGTIGQANEAGYGLGGGLALGAQAFGGSLQATRDKIADAEKQATRERLAAMKDIIGLKAQQEEMGLRMQAASLARRAQQDALDSRAEERAAKEARRQAVYASGDPQLIKAFEMFGDDAAQSIYLDTMKPKTPNTQGLPEGYMWGADGTAVPIAGINTGGVKPDAMVSGLEVAPGSRPTADDAKGVKTVKQAYTQLQTLIPEYKSLVDKYGSEIDGSGAAKILEQKQAQIALQVKNLEELGALQEADRQIINDMLGSPVRKDTLPILGRLNPTRLLDKGRSLKGIDGFDTYIKDRYTTALDTRGYVDPTLSDPTLATKPDAQAGFQTKSGIKYDVLP